MDDSPITKKPRKAFRSGSGSLAWRVLTISLLFLVIPLFLQNLFLYRQEYKQKLSEVLNILDVVGKEREAAIEQMIQREWTILDIVARDVEKHAQQLQIERIRLPAGVPDHFAISNEKRGALLIGIQETSANALVIAVPYAKLIENLEVEKTPYPVRFALIDEKSGRLLAESMKTRGSPDELLTVKETVPSANINLILTIPESLIADLQKKDYYYRLATLIFFVGVLGGAAVYWLTHRIARPLNSLGKTMERVSEGAIHARYTPDRMGFEINDLGNQFNQTLDDLLRNAQEAEKERINREKLAEELRIGHEIQSNLFPTHVPGLDGIQIATAYLPAKEVNGDFYDIFQLENGNLLLAIADTAGKGISACLYSLGLRSIIRTLTTLTTELSELVVKANDLFWIDARNTSMFATLWIGIYDPSTRRLTYCSQGHPPALLKHGKKIKELWTEGIALGAQKFDSVPTSEITLSHGDSLLLYTDGIIEAHNAEDELYGKKRLSEFLLEHSSESPQRSVNHLLKEVHQFSLNTPQHDDITLLLLHIL